MNPLKRLFEKVRKAVRNLSGYTEIGGYRARFRSFGDDLTESELIRACIRPIADQTAKARPNCTNKKIERMLELSPNPFMNGKDFLYKIRTMYELKNTAFIIIMRDGNEITGFYPMPYNSFEGLRDDAGNLFIKFYTYSGEYIFLWDDIIVVRKDYNERDIAGDDNAVILNTLDLISTSYQGISNAVESTANLRGILKMTKAMIDPEDLKEQRDEFIENYMSTANAGGVAVLDSSMEFTPVNMNPSVTNWETMKEFRENVYRFYGVSDKLLMSTASAEELQSFYELKIEPFLLALSLEMTRKIFTPREIGFGNNLIYTSNTIQLLSMSDKLNLREFVDRGAMTPNEWREAIGLGPIAGGDEPIRRLDTAPVDKVAESIESEDNEDEE